MKNQPATTPSGNPIFSSQRAPGLQEVSDKLLRGAGFILVTTVWLSAALFGLYILAFYAAAYYEGDMQRWNQVLPRLYESGTTAATTGIGLHFATGGIILILGSIQLSDRLRARWPALHRWVGRVYVLSCLLAALGGLSFILLKGTIGGTVMDIGFSLYGILMAVSAVATYRYAVRGALDLHRKWALRLYALAIGSWLYRMDYGFWVMLTDGAGHTKDFTGPFDRFMAFFFYLPNLIVADLFSRPRRSGTSPVLKFGATVLILAATTFLGVGTYYFTLIYWGPAILKLAGF